MEARKIDDQLALSGAVVDGGVVRVKNALENPAITTVILRNSPGGGSADRLPYSENSIRQHGLRTRGLRLLLLVLLAPVSRQAHAFLHR